MVSPRSLCTLSSLLGALSLVAASANDGALEVGKLARRSEAFAVDEILAARAPGARSKDARGREEVSNGIPKFMDRSAELYRGMYRDTAKRQDCPSDYGYCSNFGRCCPSNQRCCEYGYCIQPDLTCCPSGSCEPGWLCCGSKCSPRGGDCCKNDQYCEPGNVCVELESTGRIVCCTDLKCTAVVQGGTTSYMTTEAPSPTNAPAPTTQAAGEDEYRTFYYTITWWYVSYWYTTIQQTSSVTYTRVDTTTVVPVEAVGMAQASSSFESITADLTFTPPADASTELAEELTAGPSGIPSPTFQVATGAFASRGPTETGGGDSSSAAGSTRGTFVAAGTWSNLWLGAAFLTPGALMIWL